MVNTLKIKGRLAELGLRQSDVAEKLGIALPTVSQKINNVRPMDVCEALELAELLMLTTDREYYEYFFVKKVA